MILTRQKLAGMLGMIRATLDEELDCDGCFEQLDRFAEMKLAGTAAEDALPLVESHLETCPCCREEFAMLLDGLRALR
ncbi:hypothetical protein BH23PLA1_BH23PLA1_41370 [soil metagenome]